MSEILGGMPYLRNRSSAATHELWRSLIAHPASRSTWASALRRGLLPGVLVAIGAMTGEMSAFAVAAMGALNIGLIDEVIARGTLAATLGIATVSLTIVSFVALLIAGSWWTVLLFAVLAYIYGCLTGSGVVAFQSAMTALLMGVICSGMPGDLRHAVLTTTWIFLGCVLASASTLLAWRFDRDAGVRRSMQVVLALMAENAKSNAPSSVQHFDLAAAESIAEQTLTGAHLPASRHLAYSRIQEQLVWVRLREAHWLASNPSETDRESVALTLSKVRELLSSHHQTWTYSIPSGLSGPHLALAQQISQLCEAILDVDKVVSEPNQSHSVAQQARRAVSASDIRKTILRILNPRSEMGRHGTRVAFALVVAQSLTIFFEVPHGYWFSVTIIVVMRPDFATTLTRGLQRGLGTVLGVVIVGLAFMIPDSQPWLLVVMTLVAGPLLMRWLTYNYVLGAMCMTVLLLTLIEAWVPDGLTIWVRLINTIIGIAIAIATYLILPSWKGDRLADLLSRMVVSQSKWTEAVIQTLATPGAPPEEEVNRLRIESRDIALATRPAVSASIIEFHHPDLDPRSGILVVNMLQRMARYTLAVQLFAHEQAQRNSPGIDVTAVKSRLQHDFRLAAAAIDESGELHPQTPEPLPASEITKTDDATTDRALTYLVSSADSTLGLVSLLHTSPPSRN